MFFQSKHIENNMLKQLNEVMLVKINEEEIKQYKAIKYKNKGVYKE